MDTSFSSLARLRKWSPGLWGTKSPRVRASAEPRWRSLLLGGIGLTVLYVVVNLWLASAWLNRPFPGFLHQNRVVTQSRAPGLPAFGATIGEIALKEGDVIQAVNGQPVESSLALLSYLRQQPVGEAITYNLLNEKGQTVQLELPVTIFTSQRFIPLVALPVFIALITLMIALVTVYLRFDLLQVKLFALFCLALTYALASLPDLIAYPWATVNLCLAYIGLILAPIFLLHFLLVFPEPRAELERYPFILPFIYAPLLPAMIHLPILFLAPETTRSFDAVIQLYTLLYSLVGAILLLRVGLWAPTRPKKQALILLSGVLLPALLLFSALVLIPPADPTTFATYILARYSLIGIPMAVAIAVLRYGLFEIHRIDRSPLLYGVAILFVLIVYFLLISLGNRNILQFDLFQRQDLALILPLAVGFLFVRLLYRLSYNWLKERVQEREEDLHVALRIFLRELLQVKSRRELEVLISWDIPSDFRLRSAELVAADRPTTPFALKLPLAVSNVPLGTLFLGAKISGKEFTEQDLEVLEELQKQLSLALWSIELDQVIRTTEELTRLKSKFLTNVTHELRTPLNGIINYIGFVLDDNRGSLSAEQVEHLQQALQGAERLLQLINNILDMSKIEAGQMKLNLQPCDLADIVAKVVPLVAEMLAGKPVQLNLRIAPDLPRFRGDRLRIRQIILNLLANAAKFTDKGTISLEVHHRENKIVIQVADTGRGFDQETLLTIFQYFATTGLTDAGQNSGADLSLPITKALVELHEGQINGESRPGEGTTFTVLLPTRRSA